MILQIASQSATPIYEQIRDQVVSGIASGRLKAGEALPSARRLAADLGVNFHTVAKSYSILSEEGYVTMDRRRGAVTSQAISGGEEFMRGLKRKITLCAAEALCRGIGKDEFTGMCAECYAKAGGVPEGGSM